MWREFAGFTYGAFYATQVVATLYWFIRMYNVGKIVYPLSVPSDPLFNRGPVQPENPTLSPAHGVEILRLPKERAKVIEHLGSALLVMLALCIFIPLCRMALSYEKIEQSMQALVLLIVVDLTLVAAYSIWRLYQTVIRGDILVTVLLSRRTLAVVRPRKPVIFVKPIECASLVCGRNELMLRDGRTIKLAADGQLDEERTMCRILCQQWWPEAYGDDPPGIWAKISRPCRRKIAIGLGLVSLGFAMLVVDPSPWGTAIAHHFIVPGGILALFGYWTGCRGHGRVIALAPPTT